VPVGEGRRFSIDKNGDSVLDDDGPRTSVRIAGRVVGADGSGLAGITVTLSGAQSASAVTDASGRYAFNYVSTSGTHNVAPSGGAFSPASRTFANPTSDKAADFVNSSTANASDATQFFVARHYADFFNRDPDAPGLAFWTNEIEQCGPDAQCRDVKRVNVSAAFFLSIEFQQTGFLVYKTFKAAFGNIQGSPVPVTFERLTTDTQRIGRGVVVGQPDWAARLEANKQAFFTGFVQRPEFLAGFPVVLNPADFVNALNRNAGFVLSQAEVNTLAAQLAANNNTQGRASALRQVAEHPALSSREFRPAFVLMQYYGYLRRNPNEAPEQNLNFDGFNFWLQKLEQFGGNFVAAEMVKAFLSSDEYVRRFGL
jgi:hypothetical protein